MQLKDKILRYCGVKGKWKTRHRRNRQHITSCIAVNHADM